MFDKIKFFISGFKRIFNKFWLDLKTFGIKCAIYNFLGIFINLFGAFNSSIAIKQHDYTYTFLTNKYADIIEYYKNNDIETGENCKKIWCFWRDGVENAPDIVKKCIFNIEKYSGDYQLVILDNNTYQEYVNLPQEIVDKFNNHIIPPTHFSNILRARLLSLYGGVWIDVTLLVEDYIFTEFDNIIFNTTWGTENIMKKHFVKSRWCGFFMGGKPNMLFSFLYDMFIQYYLEYNHEINYLLIDYIIEIAYDYFSECKNYIDNATLYNPQIYYFQDNSLSENYDKKKFTQICNEYKYFKLTYKEKHEKYDKNGNLTIYGHLLKDIL